MTGPAAGQPVDASLIVVAGEGVAVPTGLDAEVVVVTAEGAPGDGAPSDPSVRTVSVPASTPWAAAANRGAAAARGRALCFLAPGTAVDGGEHWLAPLVAAVQHGTVAAAVPDVVNGRAGSIDPGFRRVTDGGSPACLCVRRSSFLDVGGFEPTLEGLLPAGQELTRSLRALGLSTVYEPAARVAFEGPARRPAAGGDEAEGRDRILVVGSFVPAPNGDHGDRRLRQVLADLAAVVPDGRVTLVALDGHGAEGHAPWFLRRGIEVVAGPRDWGQWLWHRLLRFTHVVVTDIPSLRVLEADLEASQPQAHRVLCLAGIDDPEHPEAADQEGLRLLAHHLQDRVARAAQRSHALWCASERDRAWLAAAAPGVPASVIPTAAATTTAGAGTGFADRTGYVVLAAPGADAGAGHDDAALHAARHVLPLILARDPFAFLRVVVDDPSPALQLLAGPNVELVPAGDDPARWLRRSRVCLAWYPRGHGWRHALTLAIDAGTPFVTSEAALDDAGAGGLAGLAAAGDPLSTSLLAQQLHEQPRLWDAFHGQLADLAAGPRSPASARLKLLRACAGAGIAPPPGIVLDEPRPEPATRPETGVRPRSVSVVGSAWKAAPPLPDGPANGTSRGPVPDPGAALPVNEQYQRWLERYGPTARRLATLRARLAGLTRRPTISVVMPVFNTEPSWLHDAISSVRAQVYEHWELCIADDGSTSPGTLEVLEQHLAEEPRIRLARLPGNQGIAAASNAALALATGEFVGLLDHDDELKAHALGEIAVLLDDQADLDIVYSDEDKRDPDGQLVDPFFKSDWSPDHLMSRNYVCHFLVVRRGLLQELAGFRLGYDGSQDYDLLLRAMERTDRIAHVHEPLYTWRKVAGSTASVGDAKPWALDSARRALKDALERRGTPGEVEDGLHPTTYRVRYAIQGQPKVSIIIPTRDRVDLLRGCIESILETSTYPNYEFVVLDNQSTDPDTLAYLSGVPRGTVVRYPHRFNYARMMNLAAAEASGDMLLFLNNDTEVVAPEWIEALVEHGQRPEVGAVGARLLYPQGHVQHEGIIVGHKGGHAGNIDHGGYWGLGQIVRNCSAVTGACMLMRPSVYWRIGGHEERLRIAYNDVDICLRVRQAGYEVVYTPYAELVHVEGGTRGIHAHVDDDDFFEARWVTHKCLDPYYNANLERLDPFRIRA